MFDHFRLAAPIYDKVIRIYDHQRICRLLELPAAVRLLDAGGGTGRVSHRLYPLVDEVVLSDLSLAMLRQADAKCRLSPVCARAELLPFGNDCFDRILVVDAFHHFGLQQQALADLVRVLKPGGLMVIEEPDITRPLIKPIAWLEKLVLMGSHFRPSQQIEKKLHSLGMKTRVENDGRFIYWVQARKS